MLKNVEIKKTMEVVLHAPVDEERAVALYGDILNNKSSGDAELSFECLYRNAVLQESKASLARELGVSQTSVTYRIQRARARVYKGIGFIFPENDIYTSTSNHYFAVDRYFEFNERGVTKLADVNRISPAEINQIFKNNVIHGDKRRFEGMLADKYGKLFIWGIPDKKFFIETGMSYIEYTDLSLEGYIRICGCEEEFKFIKMCPMYVETWFPDSGITTEAMTEDQFKELFGNVRKEVR